MQVAMSLLTILVVMTVVLNVKYEGAMKKISFVFGAAMAAIFALTSCNKEISNPDEIIQDGIPFEISAASADTKTSNDGIATNWDAGDALNLFHAEAGSTTYISDGSFSIAEEDLASKKFKGTLASALEKGNYDWYAFYPYSKYNKTPAGSSQDDFGFTTIGGTSQTQIGNNSTAHLCGTVCPLYGVAKSVASSATPGITMKHLTSIIEVNVTNNSGKDLSVSSVSFTGTEDIVGTYYINFTQTPVVYTSRGETYVSNTASLSVTGGETIADGASAKFYIAIKPFTVSSGVLRVAVNGYEKEITISNETVFTAGKIKTINFNYNPEPSIQMGPDWNAIFGTSYSGTFSTSANDLSLNGRIEGVSIAVRNGTSKSGYVNNGDFRMYQGYTVTLTPPSGKIITKVSTTKGGKDYSSGITANTGTVSISSSSLKWSGKSTNLVLTISATVSFNTMNITIDDAPSDKIKLASPTVSCSSQTANSLTFTWSAVENATEYQVSVDGGNSYASTQSETTYIWTGLSANTTKTLYVKAIGDSIFYTDSEAASAEGTTTAGSGTGEAGGEHSHSISVKPVYTLSFLKDAQSSSYTNEHTSTSNGVEWSVFGNQSLGDYLRVGGKNTTATDRSLTSKGVISSTEKIGKISIKHSGTGNGKNSSITINSIKVESSVNSDFSTSKVVIINNPSVSSSGVLDFSLDGADFDSNSYFKITINYMISGSNNCYLTINSVEFFSCSAK